MDYTIKLVKEISKLSTSSKLFNPYTDNCIHEDHNKAATIRKNNLIKYFTAQRKMRPKYIWIFEAPGYRGCRRTGLPLISENLLEEVSSILKLDESFEKATKTNITAEYSANAVWNMIRKLPETPFIWNAYPLHPFKENDYKTNRKPTKKEMEEAKHILNMIMESTNPQNILAVGRVAESLLLEYGIECKYIRHPANGGIGKFRKGITEVYGL